MSTLQCGDAKYWTAHRSGRRQQKRSPASATQACEAAYERMPVMWVLLLLPFVGLLWVPFYNFQEPALFGFPFFYWYQLAWVPICSLLIWIVYRSQKPDDETP
jgi:hypothetical protein